jgi:hypothetical protein
MPLGPLTQWDRPPGLSFRPTRRAFLLAASAAGIGFAKTSLAPARDLIRRGALGRIVFCRASQSGGANPLRALEFLLDAPSPVSRTEHGAGRVTLRYPGFIASYEENRACSGIVICGARATLVVNSHGWRVVSPSQEA